MTMICNAPPVGREFDEMGIFIGNGETWDIIVDALAFRRLVIAQVDRH